ncbi:histidine kinase N-terminal 7TM domain-containing diguanylate cyclase [Clostridium fungisolvens]|uniref:GGDEF domain-containing protein n=1 Tax=Clostridium fungisolvens TaxID=1604897 RepID=A0A6V8SMX9_9CLOT|nr:diguanylate cyclase [Clostridium fungisolvens]GFP76243.1 hypothetical protein bsdtw1_02344 [Clostridium fungisolvens]
MPLTLELISIYFFFAAFLALFFAAYALSKSSTTLVNIFSALCVSVSIYLFGYLLELNSSSLPQMIFWNQIQYIGVPFYPALWLLLSMLYTKTIKILSKGIFLMIFTIPMLTFIIRFTNEIHHFYYKSFKLKELWGLKFLSLEKGPWYIFYSVYLIFYFVLAVFFYLRNYRKAPNFQRLGYRIMISASFLPFIGLNLILLNPLNFSVNYIAFVLPFSLFLVLLALFKYDFLEFKTLARDVLFDKSADAMILINSTSSIIDFNPAAAQLFPELTASVKGRFIESVLGNYKGFLDSLKNKDLKDLLLNFGDDYGYFEVKSVTIKNDFENIVGYLISLVNVTERKHAQEALNILATTDSLTGLYNRNRFMQLANLQMEISQRYNNKFSLIMIDVDHFKEINDTKGHAAGDAVLNHLGRLMREYFRKTDIIGRLGGEEFAILLPDTSLIDAQNITEVFRNVLLKQPAFYEDEYIHFTLSMGISVYDKRFSCFDQILKLSDEALYQSKENGRNRSTTRILN